MTYQRFTVFTQDADVVETGNRKRQFTWKLKGNKSYQDAKKLKMSIESIHCRDMSILINADQDSVHGPPAGAETVNTITQKAVSFGNMDEKELDSLE